MKIPLNCNLELGVLLLIHHTIKHRTQPISILRCASLWDIVSRWDHHARSKSWTLVKVPKFRSSEVPKNIQALPSDTFLSNHEWKLCHDWLQEAHFTKKKKKKKKEEAHFMLCVIWTIHRLESWTFNIATTANLTWQGPGKWWVTTYEDTQG